MKSSVINLIIAVAKVLGALLLLAVRFGHLMWLKLSIALKRYLAIETPTYRRYWARRSKRIQKALDRERDMREMRNRGAIISLSPSF